jgi:hypothetical protein
MNDTNFSYMEVSAKRKKRNQFISVLIIVAIVLLGVIVWGWIELQKSRNAERIKHALNSQVEPGFREPDLAAERPAAPAVPTAPDTSSVVVQDAPPTPAAVEPVPQPVTPSQPAASPKIAEVPAAPKPANPVVRRDPSAPKRVPGPTQAEEPTVSKGQGVKAPEPAAPALPKEEPLQVAVNRPDPIPETPKTAPAAPKATPPAATKAYPPEDLPLPSKAVPTEETRQAVAALPPAPAVQPAEAAPAGSNNFRLGMAAYRQQDFVNAIRSFSSVPKPTTRKRGTVDRDEYVQANFLKGMALLKVGHMSEAVTAFNNVLEYEKYYPMANMNLGICYVELKQYAKAHQAFEAVVRDQNRLEPANYDDVMQRTKYFWAVAWTRLYKNSTNPDKQNYYRAQAIQKWKDYQVWFSKNDKYKEENLKAENYLKSLSSL